MTQGVFNTSMVYSNLTLISNLIVNWAKFSFIFFFWSLKSSSQVALSTKI